MRERLIAVAVVAVVLATGAFVAIAEEDSSAPTAEIKADFENTTAERGIGQLAEPHPVPLTNRAPGTIQYDSGMVTGFSVGPSDAFGNRFDTGSQGIMTSGSITQVQFSLAALGGTSAWLTFYDQLVGATANVIDDLQFFGLSAGLNTVNITAAGSAGTSITAIGAVPYQGASFLIGVWNLNTNTAAPTNDAMAFATGSTNAQGFHGMMIQDIGGGGTGFSAFTTLNAVLRPSGNVIVPVELMSFSVEGE